MPPHPAQPTERVHPEQHPIPGKPSVGDHPGYMRLMGSKIHTGGEMYTCSANGLHPKQETALGIVQEYTVHTLPPRLRLLKTHSLTLRFSESAQYSEVSQPSADSCAEQRRQTPGVDTRDARNQANRVRTNPNKSWRIWTKPNEPGKTGETGQKRA